MHIIAYYGISKHKFAYYLFYYNLFHFISFYFILFHFISFYIILNQLMTEFIARWRKPYPSNYLDSPKKTQANGIRPSRFQWVCRVCSQEIEQSRVDLGRVGSWKLRSFLLSVMGSLVTEKMNRNQPQHPMQRTSSTLQC